METTIKDVVEKANYGISAKACRIGFNECKNRIIKLIHRLEDVKGGNISGIISVNTLIEEIKDLKPKFAQ